MLVHALLLVAAPVTPPVAKKVPHPVTLHGHVLTDDFFWLREKGTSEVEAYLRAENAFTDAQLQPTEALQAKLYQEMVGRLQQTDMSVPYAKNGWLYFARTVEGKEHAILCRKKLGAALESELLDLNALRGDGAFIGLGRYTVSPDGNLLAYTLDRTGFRELTLYVKDLRTGKLLKDTARKTRSIAWAADSKTLFFVTEDAAKRPYRLYRLSLGQKPVLVTEEKDERFDVSIGTSSDEAFMVLDFGSATTNEARVLEAKSPEGKWRTVLARKDGREGSVDHRGHDFYVRVNDTGRNFRWVSVSDAAPAEAKWKELIAHRADVMLDDVLLFETFYVLFERQQALPQLRVVDWATSTPVTMAFDEPVFSVWPEGNYEFTATTFRYGYTSMVTPESVYERDAKTGVATLLKREAVLGGYDPAQYTEERLWVTASDGVKVPVSLAYKKDRRKDGKGALLLEGYGAYGAANDIGFSLSAVSLMDRGVALATAHVRGGGELGKSWHDGGRMLNKQNTFSDFIAVAEALLAQKYVSKDRLVITGASAGGLLIGAVVNQRPELFKAALALVPFVDVMNTMLDESLPLTVPEFEEWGNPKVKAEGEYMLAYSPYDNVAPKAYPAMLVKSSYNDSQVMYWESAKWVARLRATKTDTNPLLLKVDLDPAGHGGKSGRYEALHEAAFDDAFALWQMGITK